MAKVNKKLAKKTSKKVVKKKAPEAKKASKKTTKKVSKKTMKKAVKKVAPKKAPPKKSMTTDSHSEGLKVGQVAPNFTLLDQHGKSVSLNDFKGKKVVVYFYPKAMTPGCTVQACEIRNSKAELEKANIIVLGISADPVASLKKFEEKEKLNFTLLSDPEKSVIKEFGAWGRKKFMGREFDGILRKSYFLNEEGKVVHIMDKVDTKTHHQDVLNFFKNL